MFTHRPRRLLAATLGVLGLAGGFWEFSAAEDAQSQAIVHKVQASTDHLEMTVNSSRMLTLDSNIPRAQVNNKDIVDLTALAPNVIQVFAKKAGVTQVNLWDEHNNIHSIDIVVFGDARELNRLLQAQFPHASITVRPSANSVILSGFVPEPDEAAQIIKIAEDYYPKVVSLLKVGGVQQIMLHVKVMEVSRTKLRELGIDFAVISNPVTFISSVSGIATGGGLGSAPAGSGGQTFELGIVQGGSTYLGLINALRQYNLAKVMAEPTLVTVSGRPASFLSGGEIPYVIPAAVGSPPSVVFKEYGTKLDFVPIVLGNGNIRLEVKPEVSQLDPTNAVDVDGTSVPAFKENNVDTAVEMKPGQTLAIAGMLYTETEYQNQGIPYLADMPYVGSIFRKTSEKTNEVELLVLVTPELADPMDPCDVPPCQPGMCSTSPDDCGLYWKGYTEVPSCGPCGANGCGPNGCGMGYGPGGPGPAMGPGGEQMPTPAPVPASRPAAGANNGPPPLPTPQYNGPRSSTESGSLPLEPNVPIVYALAPMPPGPPQMPPPARYYRPNPQLRQPGTATAQDNDGPGFIGPTGYDVGH